MKTLLKKKMHQCQGLWCLILTNMSVMYRCGQKPEYPSKTTITCVSIKYTSPRGGKQTHQAPQIYYHMITATSLPMHITTFSWLNVSPYVHGDKPSLGLLPYYHSQKVPQMYYHMITATVASQMYDNQAPQAYYHMITAMSRCITI